MSITWNSKKFSKNIVFEKNCFYRERVASLEGSDIFLQAAGFITTTDENQENEEFWVFPPEADSTGVNILQKE